MPESPDPRYAERTFDVFFYGLYMDADTLSSRGVVPRDPRIAFIEGYVVRLGVKAMLLCSPPGRAYGMLYRLNHREMDALYVDAHDYRPEPFSASIVGGDANVKHMPVVSMVHLDPPVSSTPDQNPGYCARWHSLVRRLGIPFGN